MRETLTRLRLQTNKLSIKYRDILLFLIWLFMILTVVATDSVTGMVIFVAVLLSPIFTVRLAKRNILSILVFRLISQPAAIYAAVWLFVGLSATSIVNNYPLAFNILLLFIVPIVIGFAIWRDRKSRFELERLKLALEFHNAVFVTLGIIAAYYAFVINDFSFLQPGYNLESIAEKGFTGQDAFTHLSLFITIPFIVAGAFSKAVIEYMLSRISDSPKKRRR